MTLVDRVFILIVLVNVLSVASALYFYMHETSTKCFMEEVAEHTMVTGKYVMEVHNANTGTFTVPDAGFGLLVDVEDPHLTTILHKVYTQTQGEARGKFAFHSTDSGEYKICLSTNSSTWFTGALLKITLHIDNGENFWAEQSARNLQQVGVATDIVKRLVIKVRSIGVLQDRKRVIEASYRELSNATLNALYLWAFGQLLIILMAGFCMIRSLRSFFIAKKIV